MKKFLLRFFEVIVGVAVLAGAVYAYLYLKPEVQKKSARAKSVPIVTVSTLTKEIIPAVLEAQGNTLANESVILTASAQDKVVEIDFDDGTAVKKGDVIVRLECDLEEAALKQAELDLAEAERELERNRQLYEASASSRKEFDTHVTNRDRAKILVESARTQLEDRVVTAPFDGILGKRQISLGALVSPGTKIATLDDITRIKVDFTVPEKYLPRLARDQHFTAESIAYPGVKFTGKLSDVGVRLNSVTRSVEVRGILENKKGKNGRYMLQHGMLLTIYLELGKEERVAVPEKALLSLGELQFLFIYDSKTGTVSRREVTLGRRGGGLVEILANAKAGEQYVDEGVTKLSDGNKVKLAEQEK